MGRVLAANVHLVDADGDTTVYRAGTLPDPDVAEKITNPSAWVDDEELPATTPTLPAPTPPAPPVEPPPVTGSGEPGQEPSRNGKTEDWKAYAEALGQTVEPDAGRDAIIAQLVAAGLIEE